MLHLTSTEIAGRIEDLYGAPLAALDTHVRDQPPGMLSALLGMHHQLDLAEQSIAVHRDRLAQLVQSGRHIGGHEVSHVLDCARRIAEAVAVRDIQATTVSAVLQSLGRASPPEPTPATTTPTVPAPPARPASAPGR
ncbi:hypothetical protein ACIP4W_11775 [Streptomyces sp. NPDC088846]|uniref:hypothetical protein n=1 Tax=Streptomyces sp. NPDC088846 TaxID=3365908 RepID=UPI00380F266A